MYKVLIVDDEQDVLNALKSLLRREYEVTAMSTIEEGMLDMRDFEYDLVVLDLDIRNGAGGGALQNFLDVNKPDIPIIFHSGNVDSAVIRKNARNLRDKRTGGVHGGLEFVDKGSHAAEELLDKMHNLLNKRG